MATTKPQYSMSAYNQLKQYLTKKQSANTSAINKLMVDKYGANYKKNSNYNASLGYQQPGLENNLSDYLNTKNALQYDSLTEDNQNISNALKLYDANLANYNQGQVNATNNLNLSQLYMPQQLKANGVNSSGLAESTTAGMYNNYSNNLREYANTYSDINNSIYNDYLTNDTDRIRDYNANLQAYENTIDSSDPTIRLSESDINAINNFNANPSVGVKIDDANASSFGKFIGTGDGGKQDTYITKALDYAKTAPNGTVINMNYGSGKRTYYVVYNGSLYKSNISYELDDVVDYENIDKVRSGNSK